MNFKAMFLAAALYNWVASLFLFVFHRPFFEWLSMPPAAYPLTVELFSALAFVFGIGYYWVFRDIDRHHGIVRLGILGKCAVFLICLRHFLGGAIPFPVFLPACGDLAFAGLFIWFLAVYGTGRTEEK